LAEETIDCLLIGVVIIPRPFTGPPMTIDDLAVCRSKLLADGYYVYMLLLLKLS